MPRKKKSDDIVQASLGHRISKHEAICADMIGDLEEGNMVFFGIPVLNGQRRNTSLGNPRFPICRRASCEFRWEILGTCGVHLW